MRKTSKTKLTKRQCTRTAFSLSALLLCVAAAGCARNENYFGDRAASQLSGPAPAIAKQPSPAQTSEPFGTYRGGRDPRTGLATTPSANAPALPVSNHPAAASGIAALPTPQRAGTITVMEGDTLYGLAQKHRVSISSLMAVNGLSQAAVYPGQTLRLR